MLLGVVALVGTLTAAHLLYALVHSPYGAVLAVLLKQVDLPWGRSNYVAGILILSFPVTLGLLGYASSWRARAVWLAMLMIQATGVVVTASKGALLALVVALVVAFSGRGRASRIGLAMLAFVLGVGVWLYVYGPLQEALQYRMQTTAVDYSVTERLDLYRLSLQEFTRSPLWGIGINNFSVMAHRFHGEDTVPHNLVLGYLVELGLPGLLLVLAWVAALGRSAWRLRSRAVGTGEQVLALGLWAAFLAFIVHNQFESTIYGEQYKILLMIVAVATWRLSIGSSDPSSAKSRAPRNDARSLIVQNANTTLQT